MKLSDSVLDFDLDDSFDVNLDDEPRRPRYLWIVVGIFLLFLMTSYFIFAPIAHVVRGQIVSNPLQDSTLFVGEYALHFLNSTSSLLESIYVENQELALVETSVCLQGYVQNKSYFITEIFYPQIYEQTFTHVSFESCPQSTLIMLHTHPFKRCIASDTDKDTYAKKKSINDDLLMLVMCEEQRFSLYS